jgi:hypothetical protein
VRVSERAGVDLQPVRDRLRLVDGRQAVPRVRRLRHLVGVTVGYRHAYLLHQPNGVDETPARTARRRRRRQNTGCARGLRRHGRRGTLVAGRGVVFGYCVVVSGLHHYAAVVLQCLGQIVDRTQHFLYPLVVRRRPRLARIIGACHRRGSAEDVDVHVERVVELAGLLEQALANCVERLGVDVLDRHDSISTFSCAASV